MLRLRKPSDLCSSTLSDPANRLRKTRRKKSSAVLLISERSHIGNLRQIRQQGKGRSSKRKGNRRCPFLFAPAAGAATFPPSADGESPAEVQRKTSRPLGANTLTQFVCPGQPVQKKEPPVRGEPACGSSCAPVSRCRKRSRPLGRTRLRSSRTPQGGAEKFQQRLLTNLYACIIIIIQ